MNPKNGIPKQIPVSCMVTCPKFDNKYEKMQYSDVKESARNFSINTLRSEVDLSLDENCFEGLPAFQKKDEKSKDIKGLLKTVFSTSSLSRSLQKLGNISRNISPLSKNMQAHTFSNTHCASSKEKISLRDRIFSNISPPTEGEKIKENLPKLATYIYISDFKKEIVLSYQLNTGYVGTYEPNYKLLYNKRNEYTLFNLVSISKQLGRMSLNA